MSSTGNEGNSLLDKIMVSARIPRYVKQYAKENNLSITDLIMIGFDTYRENDQKHAIERLNYHENRVIHWKKKVLQYEQERDTKQQKCITIKREFKKQGRGSPDTKIFDKNWLESKVSELKAEGIPINTEELYAFCVGERKYGNENL